MKFDDFFNNLPFVPLSEICKHLGPIDIIQYFFHNDKWRKALKMVPIRENSQCRITMKDGKFEFTYEYGDLEKKQFGLCFAERNFEMFPRNSHFFYTIPSTNLETLDLAHLELIQLIMKLYPPYYKSIDVRIKYNSPDYAFKLLNSFPPGKGCSFYSEESDFKANGEEVVRFFENFHFENELTMHYELSGEEVRRSDNIPLSIEIISIHDARFLSGKCLKTLNCEDGEFGRNTFDSTDFNGFLRNWKNGERVKRVEFELEPEQRIDLEEVVRGLDARPWDPLVRDRTLIDCEHLNQLEYVDLKDGMDMRNPNGILGSVGLINDDNNQLVFRIWEERFPVRMFENEWRDRLITLERMIPNIRRDADRERGEQRIRTEEYIREKEQEMEKLREYLQRIESEWK